MNARRVVLLIFLLLIQPDFGQPPRASELASSGWSKLTEGFDAQGHVLVWVTRQEPASSSQNPDNAFLHLPERRLTAEPRPDFFWANDTVDLSLKPRAKFDWQWIGEGPKEGRSDSETELWVNEWRARVQVLEPLLVSYGRENLQWGPSFLSSPSNPFFSDNGRLQLNTEVRGQDFVRLIWLMDDAWSLSAIVRTGEGADFDQRSLERIYALKLDWTGAASYASLIGSHEVDFGNRVGGFAGWTASDALLIYAEAVIQRGSQGRYPSPAASPFGRELNDDRTDSSRLETQTLVGGGYTLVTGATITLEYLYNSAGYDSTDAKAYYHLRQQAAKAFRTPGPTTGLATRILGQTIDPGLNFQRRHYLLLQYVNPDIGDRLSLTGRCTLNLEDRSTRLYGSMVYSLNDHLEVYTTVLVNSANDRTEFGSLFHYQWTVGLTYAF